MFHVSTFRYNGGKHESRGLLLKDGQDPPFGKADAMSNSNKRVLVVEDDREVNTLICRYLQQRSFECDGAATGGECMALLTEPRTPDLILVDLELPDMDGVELCAQIRTRPEVQSVPVLVMTGYQQESQLDRFREVGADAYLLKPFSPRELLAKIQEMTSATPA